MKKTLFFCVVAAILSSCVTKSEPNVRGSWKVESLMYQKYINSSELTRGQLAVNDRVVFRVESAETVKNIADFYREVEASGTNTKPNLFRKSLSWAVKGDSLYLGSETEIEKGTLFLGNGNYEGVFKIEMLTSTQLVFSSKIVYPEDQTKEIYTYKLKKIDLLEIK